MLLRKKPDPAAACIAGGTRQLFWNAAQNLESDAVFDLHVDEVESLRIERGTKKLELVRSERGFSLRAPASASVALDAGNQRLRALISSVGTRVTEPALDALGLRLPLGKVTLRSTTLHDPSAYDEVAELGKPQPDGRLPLRRAQDGAVLLLPRDVARSFEVDSTLLQSAQLFDFGVSDFVSLELWFGNEHQLLRRRPEGAFELGAPNAAHRTRRST
ncbi:MAG: hypothetical protein QM756_24600 [Polyangiaceae bacterium]